MAAITRTAALLGLAAISGGCFTVPDPAPREPPPGKVSQKDDLVPEVLAYAVRGKLARDIDGDLEKAASYFEQAALRSPRNLELVLLAGHSLQEIEEYEKAARLAQWARAYHGESSRGQYELGRLLWGSNEKELAREYFRASKELDPGNLQIRLGIASLALLDKDHETAQALFKQAMEIDPDNPVPYIGLSMTALDNNDLQTARAVADKALERNMADPALAQLFKGYAVKLIAQGAYENALPVLRMLQALDPENIENYQLAAIIKVRMGHHEKARDALQRWPRANEKPGHVADMLSGMYDEIKDPGRALEHALEAVEEPDAPLTAWMRAGRLLLEKGKADQAIEVMKRAEEHFPDNPFVWLFRGMAAGLGEYHFDAVTALEKSAELARDEAEEKIALPPMFDLWIGAAYEKVERYEDAEKHLRRSIADHPEIHEAYNYLAYMWAERNVRLDEALELVKTALAADPDNGAYIDTLGWIYYRKGRYEEALSELRRALEKKPEHPVINDHVGDTLQALNRTDEAVAYWKKSFRKDPDNPEVAEKLERAGIDVDELKRSINP